MKLRFSGDSIRLRLNPAEVAQMAQTGSVRSETAITRSSVLVYELISCDDISDTKVTLESGRINVVVPSRVISHWAASQEVGVYASQRIETGRSLTISVEKDYECLDPAGNEPGAVLYPNPRNVN